VACARPVDYDMPSKSRIQHQEGRAHVGSTNRDCTEWPEPWFYYFFGLLCSPLSARNDPFALFSLGETHPPATTDITFKLDSETKYRLTRSCLFRETSLPQ
jgi:hypothetical protein